MPNRIQTHHDLYAIDPQHGLDGYPGPTYAFAGAALSGSVRLFRFDMGLAPVFWARWLLTWNPRGPLSAVELDWCDFGPTNITRIGGFENSTYTTPRNDAIDITAALNSLEGAVIPRFLCQRERGDGTVGPLIYNSAIEVVWDLS